MEKILFKKALEERLSKRLEAQSFQQITVGGSKLRFELAMAVNGYPFALPENSEREDYAPLLSDAQYMSGQFDETIDEVFTKALAASQNPSS